MTPQTSRLPGERFRAPASGRCSVEDWADERGDELLSGVDCAMVGAGRDVASEPRVGGCPRGGEGEGVERFESSEAALLRKRVGEFDGGDPGLCAGDDDEVDSVFRAR